MTNVDHYKGTTTIGIVCKDGVVLASESRVTMATSYPAKKARRFIRLIISSG